MHPDKRSRSFNANCHALGGFRPLKTGAGSARASHSSSAPSPGGPRRTAAHQATRGEERPPPGAA
eukprot:2499138-Pyramimonas_sp.AAC.1